MDPDSGGRELVLPPAVQARLVRAAELYDDRAARLALPDPDNRRDPRAARYHRQARAESTRRAYLRWLQLFLDFCDKTQRRELPATAATLEAFAVYLCQRPIDRGKNRGRQGLAPNSIRQALSAVRTYHRLHGENPPDTFMAAGVVDGYEVERSRMPGNTDGKGVPGLRLPTLAAMFTVCDPATNAGARDRAVLSLGWAMMARRSELTGLDVDHVRRVRTGVEVFVARSKTDQTGKGRTVAIPWKPELGDMCPATNTLAWVALMAGLGMVDGPLLRAVDRHDHVNGSGVWAGPPGLRMAPSTVELVIARAAVRARVPGGDKLRGHSLRRGGATDAYEGGADILSIARHGGWGERSPV
ncbi:MAG: tyrosine-type recombinase/integrase, partial [Pseudomonadota bacterium]